MGYKSARDGVWIRTEWGTQSHEMRYKMLFNQMTNKGFTNP